MSSPDKMNRKAAEVIAENEKAVIQYTCNVFKILGFEQIALPSNHSDISKDLIAFDKKGTTWENEKVPNFEFVDHVASKLKEGKNSCEQVAIYANKVIRFSFEKPIPTVIK